MSTKVEGPYWEFSVAQATAFGCAVVSIPTREDLIVYAFVKLDADEAAPVSKLLKLQDDFETQLGKTIVRGRV